MKNTFYVILLFLFVQPFTSFSQVNLGDHYEKIRSEDSSGVFSSNETGDEFYYMVHDTSLKVGFVYIFNSNLICHTTIVAPTDSVATKQWRDGLNENRDWKKKGKNRWRMKRLEKGLYSTCLETNPDSSVSAFGFTLIPIYDMKG